MFAFRRLPVRPAAFFFAILVFLLTVSTVHAREMVSVARAEINMRSGPGTRHAVQWALSKGYPLTVVGRQGQWLHVSDFERDRGWVLRSLTTRTPHHIVKAKVANLRGSPSTRGRLVGKASYGDVLRTVARRGDWVQVRTERGMQGWIAGRLLWGF